MVDTTCTEVSGVDDAKPIFDKIIAGEHPYKNKENGELYVFIYDENVNMVAHPTANLVGKNFKGKPDPKGKNFRDEIVAGALKNQSGFVDYFYKNPESSAIEEKTTYYKLCTTKKGMKLVVASGMYK